MDSLDQFLLQTKIDLDSAREELDRKDYLQPYRHVFWMEYLMPVGLEIPTKSEVLSFRQFFVSDAEPWLGNNSPTIIHGHSSEGSCAAPKMCHLYGFWPTKDYSPRFKKIFEARWKPVYLKYKMEIPT
jgi:hypothetical protein